jgi:hypothetical protein
LLWSVHEVPAVGYLAVAAVDEERAGDIGLFPGGGKAETVAGVGYGAGPADGDAISLGDEIADVDVDASVDIVGGAVDGFEAFRADEDRVGFGKAVGLGVEVKELVDGRFPALVPRFFKTKVWRVPCSLLRTCCLLTRRQD